MKKSATSVYNQLEVFEAEIDRLEGKILELEEKMDRLVKLQRSHLIKIKNNEDISDEFISQGRTYADLSPEKAWKLYQNKDFDFILIDVSEEGYRPLQKLPEAIHMPWSKFAELSLEIQSHTTPILIISEDGTNSVLACELMVRRGFFNCNNVSGGYKHWKGFRLVQNEESA